MVLGENGAVFIIGGGTDTAQMAFRESRFEQIGSIHGAAGGAACADDGVDFINK